MGLIKSFRALRRESRALVVAQVTGLFNLLYAALQIVVGLYFGSFFLVASGLFSLANGGAKFVFINGWRRGDDTKHLYVGYVLMMGAGLFYAIYNTRFFIGHSFPSYGLIPAIAIATLSFVQMAVSIVNVVRYKGTGPSIMAIKILALVSGATAIMLTQMCLLAVMKPDMYQGYNAYLAIAIGVATLVLGAIALTKTAKRTKIK